MSIMDIVAIGNKNWIQTEDGQWHHLVINKNGDAYLNGKLTPKDEPVGPEAHDPPKKRWEILDLR